MTGHGASLVPSNLPADLGGMLRPPRLPLPRGTRAVLRAIDSHPTRNGPRSGQRRRDARRGQGSWSIIILVFGSVLVIGSLLGHANSISHIPGMLREASRPTADLEGAVTHVRDGDTIEVAGTPVRIANLDCAEGDTTQGQAAGRRMAGLVRGEPVTCELEGRMSYDREVGTCALARTGQDLGEILIAEGTCGRW